MSPRPVGVGRLAYVQDFWVCVRCGRGGRFRKVLQSVPHLGLSLCVGSSVSSELPKFVCVCVCRDR